MKRHLLTLQHSSSSSRFSGDQECYYQDDLRVLSSVSKREHMRGNETLLDFRTSKFVLRISRDSYQLLKRHLQERQNNQIWNIIQEHLYIDIFDGMPRSKSQIDSMSGSLAGEARREANKVKVSAAQQWVEEEGQTNSLITIVCLLYSVSLSLLRSCILSRRVLLHCCT